MGLSLECKSEKKTKANECLKALQAGSVEWTRRLSAPIENINHPKFDGSYKYCKNINFLILILHFGSVRFVVAAADGKIAFVT